MATSPPAPATAGAARSISPSCRNPRRLSPRSTLRHRSPARRLSGERFADNSVDMGTGFDCFSPLSHTLSPAVGGEARDYRLLLKRLMEEAGFKNLDEEWWHFTLRNEPYPDTYFDFQCARMPSVLALDSGSIAAFSLYRSAHQLLILQSCNGYDPEKRVLNQQARRRSRGRVSIALADPQSAHGWRGCGRAGGTTVHRRMDLTPLRDCDSQRA